MAPIAVLLLLGPFVLAFVPWVGLSLGLWAVFDITRLHTLLTYGLIHPGTLSSLWMLVAIGLPLVFLVKRMSGRALLALLVASQVGGGLLFVFMSTFGVLGGLGMVTWGFAGALMAFWLLEGRALEKAAKVYAVYALLMMVLLLLEGTELQRAEATWATLCVLGVWVVERRRSRRSVGLPAVPERQLH